MGSYEPYRAEPFVHVGESANNFSIDRGVDTRPRGIQEIKESAETRICA